MESVTDLSWAVDLEDGVEKHPDLCREAGRLPVLGSDHHLQLSVCRNGIARPTPCKHRHPRQQREFIIIERQSMNSENPVVRSPDKSRCNIFFSEKDTNNDVQDAPDVMTSELREP